MSTNQSRRTAKCQTCGRIEDPAIEGPCPNCGSTDRIYSAIVFGTVGASARAGGVAESREETVEKNLSLLWAIRILTVAIPLFGYFLGGAAGFIIGIVGGVIVYLLGPRAVKKVVKITRDHW